MQQITNNSVTGNSSTADQEVLVKVEGVSKKFCRSLKKSLWYGLCDIAGELSPFGRRDIAGLSVSGERLLGARGAELAVSGEGLLIDPSKSQITINTQGQQPGGITSNASGLRDGEFYAVRDVSFELRRGECLGLVGHNGAGKTTLLKMLNGLIKPDAGTITMRGRVGALIALGAGFNPILTGRENIYINGSVLGLSKKEIDGKIDEIIDFAEIGEFIDMPVQNYSSGMNVRLGFSVATAMNPDVLLLDEVLAVGDKDFRDRCYKRIGRIITKAAVILVSHDEQSIRRICDTIVFLEKGRLLYKGEVEHGLLKYNASKALLSPEALIHTDPEIVRAFSAKASKINTTLQTDHRSVSIAIIGTLNLIRKPKELLALGNIVRADGTHAGQFNFTHLLHTCDVGNNTFKVILNNLSLNKGKYYVSIVIFAQNGKSFVCSARDFFEFEETENQTFGPPVYFPVTSI